MADKASSTKAGWVALALIALAAWAFWILPRQWAGQPVRVETGRPGR